MGIYDKYVLPRVLDLGLRNKDAARLRALRIPEARGDVFEVGIGSGLNLPFYSDEVRRVYGADPSVELGRMARKRASAQRVPVEFLVQSAESAIPLADASVDSVVSTWTLCSIPDARAALREMRRVLKPGGSFIFVEHGRSPEVKVARWQDRLNPIWKPICGGCNINRQMDQLIESGGFRITELQNEYLPGPRAMMYVYHGIARG